MPTMISFGMLDHFFSRDDYFFYFSCRWARNTSSLDECLDICGALPGSTLHRDNCTLTFSATGKTIGDYYAVALMVEDFSNTSTNESLSSVPVQFLIEIVNASSCSLKPIISSNLSNCTAIYVGAQLNFTSTITQRCPNTTIDDFYTVSSLNMFQSNLTQNGSNNTWTVTQSWTPTSEQAGLHVYCSVALDRFDIVLKKATRHFLNLLEILFLVIVHNLINIV